MASITIHIDVNSGVFRLSGDIAQLWSVRRARFYMTDYLKAELSADQDVRIPFQKDSENNKEQVLMDIQQILEKFGFEEVLSPETRTILAEYLNNQENFKEFTEEARQIWNNRMDQAKFADFTHTLQREMPKRTLYRLQLLSAYHLAFSNNACNFSVPGSGKTSVVYAAYAYLHSLSTQHPRYVNKLLIIGPLSSFGPWEDEYAACFGEAPDVRRLSAGVPKDERVRHFLSPDSAEITLMTYQGVKGNLNDLITYLRRPENKVMVVLDEAHRIKNTDGGVWAQSVLALAKYCKSRVVLTGTPAPNGYEDIYNLYNFIWPDKDIIGFHLHQLKEMSDNPGDSRINTLIENVHPFFIRITKRDLENMGLPKIKDDKAVTVEMGPVQRQIYDLIENSYMEYFQQADQNQSFRNALIKARMIRLQQCVTNPALLKKPLEEYVSTSAEDTDEGADTVPNDLFIDDSELMSNINRYKDLEIPAKFHAVKGMVARLTGEGKKVVIWGIFIQTIKELQAYLTQEGITSRLLIGETPVELDSQASAIETREKIIREFNGDSSSFQVIIANPSAVAESISLHKACHNAIYLERNFNAANFLQSKDRIHRIGLDRPAEVNYYYLVAQDSIDETIHERLQEKEANMLRIIESREIPLINMNMGDEIEEAEDANDIKALIKDYVSRAVKA